METQKFTFKIADSFKDRNRTEKEESMKNDCGSGSVESYQTQLSVFTRSKHYFCFLLFVRVSSQ